MLELVQRTGREFGIAVVVTSHLLGEIERVCDNLLAIDAGRLQYAGPVAAFTERSQRLLVEIDDDAPEFALELRTRGLQVERMGQQLFIAMDDDTVYDVVRDVAAGQSVPLSRMEVTRHKLEELFRTTGAGGLNV
jgi:ABC-2 type transport system ATP-binding protein